VKVHAAALNAADWHLVRGEPFPVRMILGGLQKPKPSILGEDMAGRVESVGKNVTLFRPGDDVFADLSDCGRGAFAEYVAVPENALVAKPANITFEAAAATPMAAVTALQGLRNVGKIQAGQKVLINGASGGVGGFAVQIARALGAEVTAVASTRKLDALRALGADHVIDYTREDFTRNGQRYDLILAANGNRSILDYQRALSPNGVYVMAGGANTQMMQALLLGPVLSMTGRRKMRSLMAKPNTADLAFVAGLLEAGKVKPVIDRRYPLSAVPEALAYLEQGHAAGKVVITVQGD
jgi:NADPH:quinone reductase-like Zn-dependent oxidoreductase